MLNSGLLLVMAAACGFGLNPMLAQLLYGLGFDAQIVTLYRFLLPALMLLPFLRIGRTDWPEAMRMFAMGMANAVAMLAYFKAMQSIDPAKVIFIYYTYPIFSLLLGWLMWGKRPSRNGIVAGALILVAVSLVLKPEGASEGEFWVVVSVFMAPLMVAFIIQYLAQPKQPMSTLQRLNMSQLGHLVVLLPLAIWGATDKWVPVSWEGVIWLLALAVFASSLPQFLMTVGVARLGSDRTAIAGALELVVAMLAGTMVFGQALTQGQLTAMLLVILAMAIRLEGSPRWNLTVSQPK